MHDEAEAVALWHASAFKPQRDLHELIERIAACDAMAAAEGLEGCVVASERSCMRNRLFLAELAAADLHGDHGLARSKRLFAGGPESCAATNAFDEDHDGACLVILNEEVHVVGNVAVELIAAGHCIAETCTALGHAGQIELQDAAALKHTADGALLQRAERGLRKQDGLVVHRDSAKAVRPADANVMLCQNLAQDSGTRRRLGFRPLTNTRRENECRCHAMARSIFNRCRHTVRAHKNHRMFDGLRKARKILEGALAKDRLAARVDEADGTLVAAGLKVLINHLRPLACVRCAHDGK